MGDKNTVELILSGKNEKLINALKQGEQQIKSFGDKTSATFQRAGQSMKMFSNSVVTGMAAIGISYGFVTMAKDMMEFDGTLRRIGRTADLSAKDIQGLRQTIIGLIGPNAKIKVPLSKNEFADMARALNATGIELNVIKDLLPQVGKGAVAANVNSKIYAATIGELLDKYKVLITDMPALQEQLNMALKFPDVRDHEEEFLQTLMGLSKTMRLIGAEGINNFTPLAALMAHFASEGAEAKSSIDALFNGLYRLRKNKPAIKELSAHGIEFYNKDGSIKNIEELLPQIKKLSDESAKAGKDISAVAGIIFGRPEAGKALEIIAGKYEEIIKKVQQLKTASGGLDKDFNTETGAMTNKLKEFQNQLDTFKVEHMTTALKLVSGILDQLNEHPMIAKGILGAMVGVGGLILLQKSISAIGGLINFGGDIGKGKGGLGGIAGALGKGTPVFVTNMPAGGLGGGGMVPGATGGFSKARSVLGNLGILGFIGGAGIEASSLYLEHGGPKAYEKGSSVLNSMGPMGMFGKGMFDAAALITDYFNKEKSPEVKNDIKINIKIDKDNRIIAEMGTLKNTEFRVDLDRGTAFGN